MIEILDDLQERLKALGPTRSILQFSRHADVSYDWLRKFMAGDIRNPGIMTLDRIAQALDTWED